MQVQARQHPAAKVRPDRPTRAELQAEVDGLRRELVSCAKSGMRRTTVLREALVALAGYRSTCRCKAADPCDHCSRTQALLLVGKSVDAGY